MQTVKQSVQYTNFFSLLFFLSCFYMLGLVLWKLTYLLCYGLFGKSQSFVSNNIIRMKEKKHKEITSTIFFKES